MPYKQIKAHAAATRANLSGGTKTTSTASHSQQPSQQQQPNGKKHKNNSNHQRGAGAANGNTTSIASFIGASGTKIVSEDGDDNDTPMDPNEQLQDEMRKAASANRNKNRGRGGVDDDVEMEG